MQKLLSVLIGATALLYTVNLRANDGKTAVSIKGEASLANNSKIYLQRYYNKMFFVIDSAVVRNGSFSFTSRLELPELYGVTDDTTGMSSLFVFIEQGNELFIRYDTARGGRNAVITGSPATDRYKAYLQNARNVKIEEYIKEQPASIVSAFVLYRYYSPSLSAEDIERYTSLLAPALSHTQYVKLLKDLPATLRARAIGSQAPDFALPAPDGKIIRLYDQLGKYLLIDFWAAWCGPCRRENPNVVRVYNTYKDKGFSVLGVSLDHNKDAWVKAIAKDELAWPQVSDLQFWNSEPARLYGIRGIPGNVLLDPSGKIIARNLRGEELEKKIASLVQ